MATSSYPGTYIQELPNQGAIQGASTSIPAFVGVTECGPTETPVLITSWAEYQRQFGSLVWYGMVSWSVYEFFAEGGAFCYVVRSIDSGSGQQAITVVSQLTLSAVTSGTWGNALSVMICNGHSNTETIPTPVFAVRVLVSALINASASANELENATALPNQLLQDYVVNNNLPRQSYDDQYYYVLEEFDGFTDQSMVTADANQYSAFANKINASSLFVRVAPSIAATAAVRPANCEPTSLTNGTAPYYNFAASLEHLATLQDLSLLSMPDSTTATDQHGHQTQALQANFINTALQFCAQQENLFYVIDPPFGLDVQGILAFKSGQASDPDGNSHVLHSDNAAIYYPWIRIFNPIAGVNVPMPPSGAVLGRYVYTDTNVGVFKSPAGVDDGALRSVVSLLRSLTDADQELLNPNGINAIRNFLNYGHLIWGARTISQQLEWTYIATRRLIIYVEQSLKLSLRWVVFEPNNQSLWMVVTNEVNTFLTNLWQQGGLYGDKSEQAFFVICDASNNSLDNRQAGQLNIDIGLAVQYPAEFVVIRVTQETNAVE